MGAGTLTHYEIQQGIEWKAVGCAYSTMKEKEIEILALSEVMWSGHGMFHRDDPVVVYSSMSASKPHH